MRSHPSALRIAAFDHVQHQCHHQQRCTALRAGQDPTDEKAVQALLPQTRVGLQYIDGEQRVLLNGEDVSEAIRQEAVGMAASAVF